MDLTATPRVILGMALAASDGPLRNNPKLQEEMLDVCAAYGVKDLDTSYVYSGTEELLGKLEAPKQFRIHTKAIGFVPGCLSRQSILDAIGNSLEALGTDSIDTYFFHSPDPSTPIIESLDTIQSLFVQKKFKHVRAQYPLLVVSADRKSLEFRTICHAKFWKSTRIVYQKVISFQQCTREAIIPLPGMQKLSSSHFSAS